MCPSGLQMPDHAQRSPHQRWQLSPAQSDLAPRHRGQRLAPVCHAGVDDLPHDRGRHHLQGRGPSHPRENHCRPPCRFGHCQRQRHPPARRQAVDLPGRPDWRRLGRQTQRRRRQRDRVHERRRHPQRPQRTGGKQISLAGQVLPIARRLGGCGPVPWRPGRASRSGGLEPRQLPNPHRPGQPPALGFAGRAQRLGQPSGHAQKRRQPDLVPRWQSEHALGSG